MTQYECCYKMTKTTTTTCLTFFPDILHLTIIPRVSVGHELAIIISYELCASGITVLLKGQVHGSAHAR